MLLFGREIDVKSLFRVLRAELIASQDGLTTSEIKMAYREYFGEVKNLFLKFDKNVKNLLTGTFSMIAKACVLPVPNLVKI